MFGAGNDTYDNAGHMFLVPLLARFLAASMPFGASHDKRQLTAAEALDIAPTSTNATDRPVETAGRSHTRP
jgi:thiosulfate dehydrogenase